MEATQQRMRVAKEAAQWWVVMQDEPSPADRVAYDAWLRESSLHVAETLHLYKIHIALMNFTGWSATIERSLWKAELPVHRSTSEGQPPPLTWVDRGRRAIWWIAVALILGILIGLGELAASVIPD